MAVFRKLLKNRAGDTIIPVVDVVNYLYPVGSIYMSATMSTVAQVQEALGGTWEAWGAGRVPVGMGSNGTTNYTTVEATGGQETVTLQERNLPTSAVIRSNTWRSGASCDPDNVAYSSGWVNGAIGDSGHTNGQAMENRQPYITCYMYKRVA